MPPVAPVAKECTATGQPAPPNRPLRTMENTDFTTRTAGHIESAPLGVGIKTKPYRGRPPGRVVTRPLARACPHLPGKARKQSQTSQQQESLTGPAPSGMAPHTHRRCPAGGPAPASPLAGAAAALAADLGHGVRLAVRQLGEGWLTAVGEAGCHQAATLPGASGPPTAATAELTRSLQRLGTAAARWQTRTAPCPTTAANRWAYREGGTSVIAAACDDATAVTVRDAISTR